MANETFTLKQKEFDELLKNFSSKGAEVEQVINDYIHADAPAKITPSIMGFVPVSNRTKKHAKSSNAFGRQENYNLAVKVMTSKEFNYLVFPDEALGTSVRNAPQNFTGRGLGAVTGELLDDMTKRVLQKF